MENLQNSLIPADAPFTSSVLEDCAKQLLVRYPFLHVGTAGKSVLGRALLTFRIGEGTKEVFFNAAHHANEWITSPLVMRFLEDYAQAVDAGGQLNGADARALFSKTSLYVLPMVNPDGVDLVTGALNTGDLYDGARVLSELRPDIPFPSGWKANIRGVDLNLQYPSGWENARTIKASLGVTGPGPRDYPGPSPLSEPESRAVYDLTRTRDFLLTLSFHTQGKVIYWKYLDYDVKNAYDIAEKFGELSGYAVEETPDISGYAGYKDWFIDFYRRPGFTIEAGEGVSPLPNFQLAEVYKDCSGILSHALEAAAGL